MSHETPSAAPKIEDLPNQPKHLKQEDIDAQFVKAPDTEFDPGRAEVMASASTDEYLGSRKDRKAAYELAVNLGSGTTAKTYGDVQKPGHFVSQDTIDRMELEARRQSTYTDPEGRPPMDIPVSPRDLVEKAKRAKELADEQAKQAGIRYDSIKSLLDDIYG
jgi:hypothetical protein